MTAPATIIPDMAVHDPDAFVRDLAARLADQRPKSRRFLGMPPSGWAKLLIGGGIAITLSLFAWYQMVNAQMADRPTGDEVERMIERHGTALDKMTERQRGRVKRLERGYQDVREILIRQEAAIANQKEVLDEIRRDVKQMRYRRGREK